jgi:isopenicillin N synthase-like dioxygenase
MIPVIDITPLFHGPSTACDAEILKAATGIGFLQITGPADLLPATPETRRDLLRLFALPQPSLRRLTRARFAPENPNVYRGFFPLQEGFPTYKQGIDLGPDIAAPLQNTDPADPLCEPTPLPLNEELPGWRETAAAYHRAMTALAQRLLQSLARSLHLDEQHFDEAFEGGISTLRLLHYPARTNHDLSGAPHIDSGFITLLAQDGVPGLQAQHHDGTWIDVPPREGALAVNFGGLLERWTGGRIRATRHRVIAGGAERCSIPFFYEPHPRARITPLPGDAPFEPFEYGDHLWAATTRFVEFHGMEALRPPRAPTPGPD